MKPNYEIESFYNVPMINRFIFQPDNHNKFKRNYKSQPEPLGIYEYASILLGYNKKSNYPAWLFNHANTFKLTYAYTHNNYTIYIKKFFSHHSYLLKHLRVIGKMVTNIVITPMFIPEQANIKTLKVYLSR